MPIKLAPAGEVTEVPDLSHPLAASAQVLEAAGGEFRVQRVLLRGGKREGVEVMLVDTGRVRAALLPTRGLSLWRANIDGIDCGWRSPVQGPVHPRWVALSEPSGLGWLDGFDELLVRCGLQSFGAPDFDPKTGRLLFPLHGRIGNLPAGNLELELDAEHSLLHVRGRVMESRFLQFNLHLTAQYTFALGSPTIEILDTVRNASDQPATAQLLYHINVGTPLLSEGAQLHLGARRLVARDAHAADDIAKWATYPGPTPGYVEQVYFSDSAADGQGWASALLSSADKQRGFAVHYQTEHLPYFSQWKNTVGQRDGYVTGLEPGTGFPNPRSFEEANGRLLQMEPASEIEFRLKLEGISSSERVGQLAAKLNQQAGPHVDLVGFDARWCVPRD